MSLATASAKLKGAGVRHRVVTATGAEATKFADQVVQRLVKADKVDDDQVNAQLVMYEAILRAIPKFDGKVGYYKRLADAIHAEMDKAKFVGLSFYASTVKNSVYKTTDIVCSVSINKSEVRRFTIEGRVHGNGLDANAIAEKVQTLRRNVEANAEASRSVAGNTEHVKEAAVGFYVALDKLATELKQSRSMLISEFTRFYI